MNNHKVMVTFHPSPFSKKHIEYASKLAKLYSCELLAVYVKTSNRLSQFEEDLLGQNEKIARSLGADIVVVESDRIVDSLLWLCDQNNISHLILGQSKRKNFNWSFSRSIEQEIQKRNKKLDITVLSPDENISPDQRKLIRSKEFLNLKSYLVLNFSLFPFTVLAVFILTLLNLFLIDWIDYRSLGMIYILGINLFALYTSRFSIVLAAIFSSIVWNYLFIPPRFTFHIHSKEDWLMELMFLVAAFVIGRFTRELKDKELVLKTESRRKANLYTLLKEFSNARELEKHIEVAKDFLLKLTGADSSIYVVNSEQDLTALSLNDKEEKALHYVLENKIEAGRLADRYSDLNKWFIPLKLNNDILGIVVLDLREIDTIDIYKKIYIDAVLNQLAISIDRDRLYLENSKNRIAIESQKIMNAVLSSVSHELRTPLATIKGFATALQSPVKNQTQDFYSDVGEEIVNGVERLELVVQNLLDMSRLETGYFKIKKDIVDLSELIFSAKLRVLKQFPKRNIIIQQPGYSLFTLGDFVLLQQTLENVLRNACIYSDKDVILHLYDDNQFIYIEVLDEGPGILDADKIFDKFYRERPQVPGGTGLGLSICKSFLEMHGGSISAENRPAGGSVFRIVLIKEQLNE